MPRFRDRVAKGQCLHCAVKELLDDWYLAQGGEAQIDREPCTPGDRMFNDLVVVLADIIALVESRSDRRLLMRKVAEQLPGLVTDGIRRNGERAERKVGSGAVGHA